VPVALPKFEPIAIASTGCCEPKLRVQDREPTGTKSGTRPNFRPGFDRADHRSHHCFILERLAADRNSIIGLEGTVNKPEPTLTIAIRRDLRDSAATANLFGLQGAAARVGDANERNSEREFPCSDSPEISPKGAMLSPPGLAASSERHSASSFRP
jgi:hypothetical protein